MWWIPLVAASDALPLPAGGGRVSYAEVRGTHAVWQEATRTPSGHSSWGWAPNLGVTASAGYGIAWVQGELGLHGALGWRPWGPEGRVEPRAGVRFAAGPVFATLGPGLSVDDAGVTPVALASIGAVGRGERVRPVFAVDARASNPTYVDYAVYCEVEIACSPPPFERPGGMGVLASVGVQWIRARGRTSP